MQASSSVFFKKIFKILMTMQNKKAIDPSKVVQSFYGNEYFNFHDASCSDALFTIRLDQLALALKKKTPMSKDKLLTCVNWKRQWARGNTFTCCL
ncbi:hypothetical protein RFI_33754 [Reticulomyxa filosa]|uniref:Uncharacterized protein n=1 Tax=Reticulomyxa filosa TaxID=46433 RepID=X6LNZ5_RETFI|nr:hypothetical protein RFI_33754 [Reticulomyxa filosa]|eukprot:ETO03648.1 hypothetical protein RFI_33754 [Reticulomyxa filosa]